MCVLTVASETTSVADQTFLNDRLDRVAMVSDRAG
jgi:hypothetical protein